MVSIVIPAYQVSNYIERCISSVIAQTYGDIECVIVDDATQDDSIVKCENLIHEYNGPIRFKIINHELNLGLSAARNTGTNAANGEYIFYLDSDDEITPDCIEKLMAIARRNPAADMVHGNSLMIPADKRVKVHLDKRLPTSLMSNEEIRFYYQKHWIPTTAWNKLIKRSFLEYNKLLFKDDLVFEDLLWMFFVVKHLKSICFCRDYTYYYYVRPGSIVNSTDQKTLGNSFLMIYDEILNKLTSGHERNELDCYVEGFCKCYLTYKKVVPEFDNLYRLYVQKVNLYRRWMSRVKLIVTYLMASVPFGHALLQTMKDAKTKMKG